MHTKLATLMKLKHKQEELVYIDIESYGSKCIAIFKYLLLDILNHTPKNSCSLCLHQLQYES